MKTLSVSSTGKARGILVAALIIFVLLLGAVVGFTILGNSAGGKTLTHDLSVPLGGATAAKIDINAGTGNLTVDRLTGSEQVLANGTLQYQENQGMPTQSLDTSSGLAALTLRASGVGLPGPRLPWEACNGESEWQIHLNSIVQSELTANSDGGNIKLDLAGIAVTRIAADTGGGNIDIILPDSAANLSVTAKTGAGNVTVLVPSGIAAKIHATTGLGKAIVDARFTQIDDNTYQSPDYDGAANKIEITLQSGAGNVSVNTK